MKSTKIIKSLFAAVLPLLVFASTNGALAQTALRIAFTAPVSVQTSVRPAKYATYDQIFSMNPDGSGVEQLTSAAAISEGPKWSPDQQYIAFVRTNYLMVMRADGNGSFKVVPASSAGWVDWSADGTKLIYTNPLKSSDGTYHDDLYVVTVNPSDGAVGTPAFFAAGPSYDPNWSDDGTKVAFDRYPTSGGGDSSIIVRDVATGVEYNFSALVAVTAAPNNWFWGPHWNPDGTMLAFEGDERVTTTTKKGTTTTDTPMEVFIANADASGLFQVTPSTIGSFLPASWSVMPAWSPDGLSLAFLNGNSGIYTTVLGSGVFTFLHAGIQPDWNP
jgi:Tol biopolymer transport system component